MNNVPSFDERCCCLAVKDCSVANKSGFKEENFRYEIDSVGG